MKNNETKDYRAANWVGLKLKTMETKVKETRILAVGMLARIADATPNDNMESICLALDRMGVYAGLDKPHRLAQYVAQIAHESGRFRYDRELWDGKGAQAGYEGRLDLGNTEPGDGKKFRGHTPIQITGRANTKDFRDWCRTHFQDVPDFLVNPDLMNADPWEGLGPIWYWSDRDLNRYADQGNIELITRRINGGLNGYADRLELYDRTALVFAGYLPTAVRAFQADHDLTVDGISGPITRAKMHDVLSVVPRLGATNEPPAASVQAREDDALMVDAPLMLRELADVTSRLQEIREILDRPAA